MTKVQSRSKVIGLCVAAYTVSYLCRTNLSVAMDDLLAAFQISRGQAGIMSTLYFWTYTGGQLLAAWLCSRMNPVHILALGLCLTGGCNLAFGFAGSYPELLFLWALNGLALAQFWPPVLQISTNWSRPEHYTALSILLNLPTTVGFLLSWAGLGALHTVMQWEWMFWIPAAFAFLFLIVWLGKMQPSPEGTAVEKAVTPAAQNKGKSKGSLLTGFLAGGMLGYAIIVVIQGCTKESINLWAPTLIQDIAGSKNSFWVSSFTALIPLVSTIGLLLTGWLVTVVKQGQERAMLILLCIGMISGWLLLAVHSLFGIILCLSILLAVVYGVNTILTTILPLRLARSGHSGTLSGIFNFLSYLGAALGGLVSGSISDVWGWSAVYTLWAVLATAGVAAMLLGGLLREKL